MKSASLSPPHVPARIAVGILATLLTSLVQLLALGRCSVDLMLASVLVLPILCFLLVCIVILPLRSIGRTRFVLTALLGGAVMTSSYFALLAIAPYTQ